MNNLFRSNIPEFNNEFRGDDKEKPKQKIKKNKFEFKKFKKNTIKSVHDVNYFLNHFSDLYKYVKLYRILK